VLLEASSLQMQLLKRGRLQHEKEKAFNIAVEGFLISSK